MNKDIIDKYMYCLIGHTFKDYDKEYIMDYITNLKNKIKKARELLKKELYNPLESKHHYDIERLEKDLLNILGDDDNDN